MHNVWHLIKNDQAYKKKKKVGKNGPYKEKNQSIETVLEGSLGGSVN